MIILEKIIILLIAVIISIVIEKDPPFCSKKIKRERELTEWDYIRAEAIVKLMFILPIVTVLFIILLRIRGLS